MRTEAIKWGLLVLVMAAPGCRSRSDLVEAELRCKDRLLREAKAEVEQTRAVNEALEKQFLAQQGGAPTGISPVAGPKDITVANGTGGVNNDGEHGDLALQVVVVPRDEDGHPVRAIGTLLISAVEIFPGGVKAPLSTWEINSTDLRRTWKSGLIGSGYNVVLNWKRPPTQNRMRVTAQFTLPDGRVFEADKDITIHPPAAAPGASPTPAVMPAGPLEGPAVSQ